MIDKRRLEELIEQGATVYSTDTKLYGCVKLLELENKLEKLEFNKDGEVKLFIVDNGWWHWFNIKDLYEDKEEAEWVLEFGCIERTERLVLPTWEEFDGIKFVWFVDKNQNQCCLYYLNCADKIFINVSGEVVEIGKLTKENYTLAWRKAKELFLGEKDE